MGDNMRTFEVLIEKDAPPVLGLELGGLKEQLNSMESTLNNLKKAESDNSGDKQSQQNQSKELNQGQQAAQELQKQIQNFRCKAQEQQKQTEKSLEDAINKAICALTEASQQLKSHQILTQMNQFIEQSQQQLNSMGKQEQQDQGKQQDSQGQQYQQNQQGQQGQQDQQKQQDQQGQQDQKSKNSNSFQFTEQQ